MSVPQAAAYEKQALHHMVRDMDHLFGLICISRPNYISIVSMPSLSRPSITMVTAIAASNRLNTFETALIPPCPKTRTNQPLNLKNIHAPEILQAKDISTI